MPHPETIHEYYLHQHHNIEHYLGLCLDHADREMVHELRLSFKRLRAFNILVGKLCLPESSEHIHIRYRVRQLYKLAGQLRDTQVQRHLLDLLEKSTGEEYPEFGKWLLRREKKRVKRFGRKPHHVVPHATAHLTHQKIGRRLERASDETVMRHAADVLEKLFSKVRKLAGDNPGDRKLHRIRILTKQIRYITGIMLHSYPGFGFAIMPVDTMRKIEVASGRWHDSLVRVEMLHKFLDRMEGMKKPVEDRYKRLLDICVSEKDEAYAEACRVVKTEILNTGD
jgi:CHAD domain-containing protein